MAGNLQGAEPVLTNLGVIPGDARMGVGKGIQS
jgi:hypothetical protein